MKKILWAVDAFQTDAALRKSSEEFLRKLAQGTGCQIEPVYLLSPDQMNLDVDFSPPWVARFRPAAERALDQLVGKLKIPNLQAPKVIIQKIPSLNRGVAVLNSYAISTGADAIAVATHAKTGLPRFFMGSFTESLLLAAKMPVFSINPGARIARDIKKILFATDLSKASLAAFPQVVQLAKELDARLVLFHQITNPVEPIMQSGVYLMGGGWIPVGNYVKLESEAKKEKLDKLAAQAARAGVRAEAVIETQATSVAEGITEAAERSGASFIALAGQSGPIAAALIGSIARQVVRRAEIPVWVIRDGRKSRRPSPKK